MRGLVARSDTELLQVAALELSWRIVDSAAAAYSRFNEPRIRGRERHMQAAHGIHAAGTRERRREVFQHVRQTELLQVSDARAQLGSSFQRRIRGSRNLEYSKGQVQTERGNQVRGHAEGWCEVL